LALQRTAADWLATAQAQLLRGDASAAQDTLAQALAEHPDSVELRRARAGACQRMGQFAEAESLLREVLAADRGDAAAAFSLARLLKEQGRTAAAAATMRACLADARHRRDPDLAIKAIEFLDDCDRKFDAAAIALAAIADNPASPACTPTRACCRCRSASSCRRAGITCARSNSTSGPGNGTCRSAFPRRNAMRATSIPISRCFVTA
jgi:tetratricopeptide (TPR) repeat protein